MRLLHPFALPLALAILPLLLIPAPVAAESCLLDTNGDGIVQGTDGDQGASTAPNDANGGSGDDDNLACGATAAARGDGSTALGYNAQAGTIDQLLSRVTGSATAVGANASARGNFGTAIGFGAQGGQLRSPAGHPRSCPGCGLQRRGAQ